jgi:hypothetical protein
MAILSKPDTDVNAAAAEVRQQMTCMVRDAQRAMNEVVRLLTARRAAIATALGTDAADLATVWAKAKAMVEAAGETAPDLPAA